MSDKLVKKWLGEDKTKDLDGLLKKNLGDELEEIKRTIDQAVQKGFAKSLDEGCKSLAQIHHNLFESAVTGKSEKAITGIQYLKSKLHSYLPEDMDVGLFFVLYAKHWFKLFLVLESRASDFVTWMSYQPDDQLNYSKIIADLNETIVIDYSIIEKESKLYSSVDFELKNILSEESYDPKDVGTNLRRLIQTSLRLYLTNAKDSKLKLQYIAYFIGKQISIKDINFSETFHEYGKAWYKKSLLFKQWFHKFIDALMKNPDLERKMYTGYNWSKWSAHKPLKKALEEREKKD